MAKEDREEVSTEEKQETMEGEASQEELTRVIKSLLEKEEKQSEEDQIRREWRQLAMAVDRWLFWAFFFVTTVSTLCFIVVVPGINRINRDTNNTNSGDSVAGDRC